MFKILGIDHIVLRIADRERSLGFYRDLLGLCVEREQADIGLLQLRAGRALIDLVPARADEAGAANVDHFALEIQPFDERQLREHFTSHGVPILESGLRYGAGGEGPSIYVCDPDGNKVELKAAPPCQDPPTAATADSASTALAASAYSEPADPASAPPPFGGGAIRLRHSCRERREIHAPSNPFPG